MKHLELRQVRSGITLIEMMVGLAVVGVVLAMAAPSFSALLERRRVIAAAGEVSNMFAFARSEANVVADTLLMHMEPVPSEVGQFSCIRISAGSVTDFCRCDLAAKMVCGFGSGKLLREFVLPRDTNVRFDASPTKGFPPYVVNFKRDVHSTDVMVAQVTVKGTRTGAQLRVEYNGVGRIRTCSPDGSISGFSKC